MPELFGATIIVIARRVPPLIGGEERQVSLLCAALVQARAAVEVWTLTTAAQLPNGARVRTRPRPFSAMPLYLAWLALSLAAWRAFHLRTPVAVVTTRVSGDSALMARLGRLLRIPVVMFLTGGVPAGSEFRVQRRPWVRRWIINGSAAMVAHSELFLDQVRSAGFTGTTARISTLVGGRQPSELCQEDLPVAPGTPRLIWCGRNAPVKNMVGLSRMFNGALRALGNPSLLLVVDEPPIPAVGGAELHLRCPWPSVHMASSDVLVLTSIFEGQPMVMAEAALTGTPTVAYAVGGIPETMARLDGGEVVKVDASDEDFAEAVRRVWRRFSDTGERLALSQRAERFFRREPPAAWVDLMLEVIHWD